MKKTIRFSALILMLSFLMSSCAKIYYSPDARQKAATHKIIAIVTPKVSISGGKNTDAAAIKIQQDAESISYQKEIYAWMLKRKPGTNDCRHSRNGYYQQ